jgi:glucosyl-3-phosphoglycerate synthase
MPPSAEGAGVLATVAAWFARRTTVAASYPLADLVTRKEALGSRVSVVLPARNERETVGDVVAVLRTLVDAGLIDQILVVDSGSTDDTVAVATRAGAEVVRQADLLPSLGDRPGKGEALWKSLAAATGDLIAFVDADLEGFTPQFVTGLLGPLLTDPTVAFVKGTYDRPLILPGSHVPTGGGRVTELVARPLLNQFWPELAGFVQPLGGECAARREVLERIPFAGGYGVELGMLVDLLELVGLEAMAQVDLGRRVHGHQTDEALATMAGQVMLTAWGRLDRLGRIVESAPPATTLTQFRRGAEGLRWETTETAVTDRPPLAGVAEYRDRLVLDR